MIILFDVNDLNIEEESCFFLIFFWYDFYSDFSVSYSLQSDFPDRCIGGTPDGILSVEWTLCIHDIECDPSTFERFHREGDPLFDDSADSRLHLFSNKWIFAIVDLDRNFIIRDLGDLGWNIIILTTCECLTHFDRFCLFSEGLLLDRLSDCIREERLIEGDREFWSNITLF